MKTRIGFVSNSSSSSYIIYRRRDDLTQEQRDKINSRKLEQCYGDGFLEDYLDELSRIPDGAVILTITSIEFGAEEGIEDMIDKISEELKYDGIEIWIESEKL